MASDPEINENIEATEEISDNPEVQVENIEKDEEANQDKTIEPSVTLNEDEQKATDGDKQPSASENQEEDKSDSPEVPVDNLGKDEGENQDETIEPSATLNEDEQKATDGDKQPSAGENQDEDKSDSPKEPAENLEKDKGENQDETIEPSATLNEDEQQATDGDKQPSAGENQDEDKSDSPKVPAENLGKDEGENQDETIEPSATLNEDEQKATDGDKQPSAGENKEEQLGEVTGENFDENDAGKQDQELNIKSNEDDNQKTAKEPNVSLSVKDEEPKLADDQTNKKEEDTQTIIEGEIDEIFNRIFSKKESLNALLPTIYEDKGEDLLEEDQKKDVTQPKEPPVFHKEEVEPSRPLRFKKMETVSSDEDEIRDTVDKEPFSAGKMYRPSSQIKLVESKCWKCKREDNKKMLLVKADTLKNEAGTSKGKKSKPKCKAKAISTTKLEQEHVCQANLSVKEVSSNPCTSTEIKKAASTCSKQNFKTGSNNS